MDFKYGVLDVLDAATYFKRYLIKKKLKDNVMEIKKIVMMIRTVFLSDVILIYMTSLYKEQYCVVYQLHSCMTSP